MQPYPRAPDLVWPGHLHGTGCLSARAVGTGFPTVGLRLWFGPGCGWSWVLFTPARCGWGLGWVCLGSVCGVVPLLSAVCGVRGWALVSACFRVLCGFVRVSLAPRHFRFRCAVWACVLDPGLGCAPPFLAGLSGCVFCAFFFRLLGVPVPGLVVPPPVSFLSGWTAGFFFFFVCLFRCLFSRWAAVPGLVLPVLAGWSPCACLGVLSSVPSGWGVWPPSVVLAGGLVPVGCFRAPPPFFFGGGGLPGCSSLCLPSAGACSVAGVWCGWSLAEVPVWYSPPLLAGFRRRWWWVVPATPGWGLPAAVVCGVWRWCVGGVVAGVWCGWSLATPGGGSCVLLPATPGWVSLPVVVGGPRHSWLGSVGGVAVWCVVCGGGVLVGLWLVCGVVGPSPLLAEVPVCYSPPLLAGFRCRWWWAVPATPGWGPLAAVVCGAWRWCVGGVVAGVWCGWSLATPGGGSCVLLPATPGWVSLPVVVGGPRHSWLGSVGGVAVWCVVCGGGVLVGLWLVCGVVGPSPLLAEVPVCYSPPLLAGFRCRWWWAVPATPGLGPLAAVVCGVWCVVCGGGVLVGLWLVCGVVGPSPLLAEVPVCYSPPLPAGFRCRWWWAVPATPGLGPLAASVCGVWRWCVVGVVVGVWCGWSLATPGGGPCVLLPATPGWVSLPVVVGGPRHSWLGFVGGGGVWCVACGVLLGSLATPGGGSCVLLPATPGWVSLPLVVGGARHSWLGSAGGGGVRALLGRVGRAGLPGAFWCASPFPLAVSSFCFAWPPPGWGCPSLFRCCSRSSLVVFLGLPLPGSRLVCVSRLAVGCSLVVAPPPPPPLCVSRFSSLLLVALVFCFYFSFFFFIRAPPLSPAFSGFRPRVPWASALALFVLLAFRFSALRALVPLSCFPPGCWLLPRGCCPPPPPFVSRGFRSCRSVLCAVRPWVRCCAALLRVVSPGVVLLCAVLRSFGAAACCAVPSGAARRPGALCSVLLCFAVFPRAVCSVLCVFCRGAVVRAVVRCSAWCCVCLGVLCCAFPVLSVLCGAVFRCAGALALCCSCGACCCWRLVLWCAAVCCAVSCGVPWCGAGSGGPWLSAGGVFRCRCPCLAAWSASLWLVWFAVVPCFPVSCSVVLCCRVVLCCCALLSCCGAFGACFAFLWAVVLCCVVLLVGCAVFGPVVVSACCGALFLALCVPCLLRSVRCGALLCWLWSPASLCRVLWRCAVVWCCAVVLCCRFAVLFVFALPSCGLSCGASVVCAVVGASCCGVSLCVVVSPWAFCGVVVLLWCIVVSCCAVRCPVVSCALCRVLRCRAVMRCCAGWLCCAVVCAAGVCFSFCPLLLC